MADYNKVLLIGNLTRDPELKYLPSGTAVVEFGLATNRRWRDRESGEQREAVTYVDCKTMGRPAETLNQYMAKGRQIFIEGRLDYRSWEAKDGTKRNKLEVFIENFQFLGSGREGGAGPRQGDQRPRRAEAAGGFEGAGPASDYQAPGTQPPGDQGQGGGQGQSHGDQDDVPF